VVIGMDVAASEFYSEKEKTYDLNFKDDVSPGFGICFYEFAHVNI
jgi:enolase